MGVACDIFISLHRLIRSFMITASGRVYGSHVNTINGRWILNMKLGAGAVLCKCQRNCILFEYAEWYKDGTGILTIPAQIRNITYWVPTLSSTAIG